MRKTSLNDLKEKLQNLKLPKNHIYIIHSSLLKFGLIERGFSGVMDCLYDTLGDKSTIIMPSFSFKYGTSRVWDYYRTQGETGGLTEFFRKMEGTDRTIHPFHSLSVTGPAKQQILSCRSSSSFGSGSPFDFLYQHDGINISLGTEFEGGATFLHHTEELAQVPYRYHKEFPGLVIDKNGLKVEQTFSMFVRKITKEYEYENHWDSLWDHFMRENFVRLVQLNGANIFSFNVKQTHDNFLNLLQKHPYFCAKKVITGEGVNNE